MQTWIKPIATILASAGVLVSSALPQLSFGRSIFIPRVAQEESGEFTQDARPFSTPYRDVVRLAEPKFVPSDISDASDSQPIQSEVPRQDLSHHSATVESQDWVSPQPEHGPNDFVAPLAIETPESRSALPTVILHPPGNQTRGMTQLTVDVEPIAGSGNREFAVRMVVPDSVKMIEVTPLHDAMSPYHFKIQMGQEANQSIGHQPDRPITSIYSMPIAAPVRSASSLNAVRPITGTDQPAPTSTPQTIPVNQEMPVRHGFQRNPFFPASDENRQPEKPAVAIAPRTSIGPPQVLEMKQPRDAAASDRSAAKQALYSTTLSESFSPRQSAISANQMSYVASVEPDAAIHSAMFGPVRMGLGEAADFTICVSNPTADLINDITVGLTFSSGLEVVVLDRAAQFDEVAQSLAWHIPALTPGQEQFIRYRVKSLVEGIQQQQFKVGAGSIEFEPSQFETVVEIERESPEAPMLPFESK